MKRIALFLAVGSLHAASYYVSSTGNDSTGTGSSVAPWRTLGRALGTVANGDTINIVANGSPVTCDATLPATVTNITVQSSKLALLNPVGYRVNPANDSANFGKCQFSGDGLIAQGEAHGFRSETAHQVFTLNNSTGTFTLTSSNGFTANGYTIQNGSQVEFEVYNILNGDTPPPSTVAVPSPLTTLTHYYVVNCSSSPACGAQNSTFQVSATSGGSPITSMTCDSDCQAYTMVGLPLQVDASADTITATEPLTGVYANGVPVTFASGSRQLNGTLPAPLQQDVIYYVVNLSGNSFKVSATLGGSAIDITTVGAGMITVSNANVPYGWKFSGIEFAPTSGTFLYNVIVLGGGHETSQYSMVNHVEFDRIWCHDFSNTQDGPLRCIADNSQYLYVHDSYIAGMKSINGDAQAISGWSSLGPTAIINNFLEGAGENIMYGGSFPTYYPLVNQNKMFIGNYFYKPFIWKWISTAGAPSGACLYDLTAVDPNHTGAEFYLDTMASQGYICNAGTWTTTGSTPNRYVVKNMLECKSCRNFVATGNLFQGNWVADQAGQAITFLQKAQSGPGIGNDHITFTDNKITNVYGLITATSHCTGVGTGVMPCLVLSSNHVIKNNLVVLGGTRYCWTSTICTGMVATVWGGRGALQDTFDHNTIVAPDGVSGSPYFPTSFTYERTIGATLSDQMVYANSIHSYDFTAQGSVGIAAIANNFTRTRWDRMAFIGAGGTYTGSAGTGNTVSNTALPANTAAVGFVNAAAGDYHLSSASPYSAGCSSGCAFKASDGTDLGADIDAVNMAMSGAAAGTPPWNVQTGLRIVPGSTKLVLSYQAPSTAACTATIYSAPARISGNQVVSAADSAGSSIADILTRQLYITGLTASTHYWYKLVCGGSMIMVGDFSTRAGGSGTYQFTFDFTAATAMRYSSSAGMSGAVSLPAATRQVIPVAANAVVYAQVGTTGPITILIAP